MSLWVVTADCGDFYCEGDHVLAVATSPAEAARLKTEAEAATWTNRHGGSGKRWNDVAVEEVPVDALRETAKGYAYG